MTLLDRIDHQAFGRELDALRKEIDVSLGPRDVDHMRRFEFAARVCVLLGYATAWILINPVSALLISTGNFVRWAVLMHHVAHRGYDKIADVPPRYSSRRFAVGWRRLIDWLDWVPPDAWRIEHNQLHHARTNEEADPDLVERNTASIRNGREPLLKYLQLVFFACTWKVTYYLPTVLRAQRMARLRRAGSPSPFDSPEGLRQFFNVGSKEGWEQWREVLMSREFWIEGILPYGLLRFVVLPALFLPLGSTAAFNVLITSLLAEVFTNIHSFLVIVPNHTGSDLIRFDTPASNRAEYYLRQVLASANYSSPGAWSDFLQGGLNFQIEHHVWPDLPLSKYREYAPRVRAICERHGVPYVVEPLLVRVRKCVDVATGRDDLQRAPANVEEAVCA